MTNMRIGEITKVGLPWECLLIMSGILYVRLISNLNREELEGTL